MKPDNKYKSGPPKTQKIQDEVPDLVDLEAEDAEIKEDVRQQALNEEQQAAKKSKTRKKQGEKAEAKAKAGGQKRARKSEKIEKEEPIEEPQDVRKDLIQDFHDVASSASEPVIQLHSSF